jgi:hypothetical protein
MLGLLALLMAGATATTAAAEVGPPKPRPHVLKDAGWAAAASVAIALGKPDIRRALFHDASLRHVLDNFADPVGQVRRGTRRDIDPFWVNDVAHPGLFALEALALKRRGYGDGQAFLFTQVHSVVWEFVIEGSAFEPSGKDLVADAAGAAGALWLLHPIAVAAERRITERRAHFWDHGLRWLDPLARRNSGKAAHATLAPARRGIVVAIAF